MEKLEVREYPSGHARNLSTYGATSHNVESNWRRLYNSWLLSALFPLGYVWLQLADSLGIKEFFFVYTPVFLFLRKRALVVSTAYD